MKRPVDEATEVDALADDAGTRAMVDLMLGTTALLLVVLLAVGAQAMRQTASPNGEQALTNARLDALFAEARGPVIFAGAGGIRLAGSNGIITVSEISGSSLLPAIVREGTPVLVIAPDGVEAAFHLTARLAALGITSLRRVRLDGQCAAIEKVEISQSAGSISCRRR